jgi:uncharacterized DUF497 family protein
MEYEWDESKNRSNIEKHSIGFDDAIRIFERPILEKADQRQDYGEDRIVVVGLLADKEVVVVYTVREGNRRIISARRANRDERAAYRKRYSTQN